MVGKTKLDIHASEEKGGGGLIQLYWPRYMFPWYSTYYLPRSRYLLREASYTKFDIVHS